MKDFQPKPLPPDFDFDTVKILKQLVRSHKALAELKGVAQTIPNETILINTLSLQEAKDSSEIENIVTTHDELYKENIDIHTSAASKEAYNYSRALQFGFEIVRSENMLLNRHIVQIQELLVENSAGIRSQSGTVLKNSAGETVYTPPQSKEEILSLLANLEQFINNGDFSTLDPLIKMAVVHYQFESIHPFYDGNGRTGRIINILYLVLQNLLNLPILYLSRYITQNKQDYYTVLQNVRDNEDWETMVLYFLEGIEKTAGETVIKIDEIRTLLQRYKNRMRAELPKIYSQDLLNNLFKFPYTRIDFLVKDLGISRQTASSYLDQISEIGLLEKVKVGKYNYFINVNLASILSGQ